MEERSTHRVDSILRRVLLFALFVFFILIFLVFKNVSLKELWQVLNPFWFLMLFVVTSTVICLNGIKFKLLVRVVKGHISYFDSLKIVLSSVFASNVTPYYAGGFVTQIYLLKKFDREISATLVAISYTILSTIASFIFSIPILFAPSSFIAGTRGKLLLSIILFSALLSVGAIILMAYPEKTKKLILAIVRKFKIKANTDHLMSEVDNFSESLKFMLKNKMDLLILVLISVASLFCSQMIGLVSLKAISIDFNFYEAFITQVVSNFIASVGITPGGIGIVEGSYLLLFLPIAKEFAPLQTFLYRIFSFYLPAIAGGIVFYRVVGTLNSDLLYK
jgi:uncharacterized protein (TIRG00374 family)